MRGENQNPPLGTTTVLRGKHTSTTRMQTLARALQRLDICEQATGTLELVTLDSVKNMIADAAKGRSIRVRFITEINAEDILACEELMNIAEVRHLDGVKGGFVVTEGEYFASTMFEDSSAQAIHSDVKPIVEHQQYLFETLWGIAVPAKERLQELREGTLHSRIEVIHNPTEIQRMFLELVGSARTEVLFLFPTPNAFRREETLGVIDTLEAKAASGVRIRVLLPADERLERRIRERRSGSMTHIDYRTIQRPMVHGTVTILIVDGQISFVLEQKNDAQEIFVQAIGLATYSSSKSNVLSNVLFFETLWHERELREKEAAARIEVEKTHRRSQLLQDILTHDMRNYLQSLLFDVEGIRDLARDENFVRKRAVAMLKTLERSNTLIERARKLDKIVAPGHFVNLLQTDVGESLDRSLSLVESANPGRKIVISPPTIASASGALAMADELLDEVFVNVLANAVKYTDASTEDGKVPIEVAVKSSDERRLAEEGLVQFGMPYQGSERTKYWQISIADHGTGIPDEMKGTVFRRYLETAKGIGLGLSIVHALVVDRYGGALRITDRVKGDYKQGAKVEIWLKRSS